MTAADLAREALLTHSGAHSCSSIGQCPGELARAVIALSEENERLCALWKEYDDASSLDYDDFDGDDAAWDKSVERAHASYNALKAALSAPPRRPPMPEQDEAERLDTRYRVLIAEGLAALQKRFPDLVYDKQNVKAALARLVQEERSAEREACAKIADDSRKLHYKNGLMDAALSASNLADRIRARRTP